MPAPSTARRALAWTQVQVQLHHLGISHGAGRPVPAPRQTSALRRPDAAPAVRNHRGRQRRPAAACGASAFRATCRSSWSASRRDRAARPGARSAAGGRVLADEAPGRRPGDAERTGHVLCPGSADRAGDAGPGQPVAAPDRARSAAAGHIFLLRADLIPPGVRALLSSVARVVLVGERGRLDDQIEYAPDARSRPARSSPSSAAPPRSRSCRFRGPRPTSSTSTALAASPMTARST